MDYKYLLDCSPNWLQYAIHLHLCHKSKDALKEIRKAALADPLIKEMLSEVAGYHESTVSNHRNPDLSIHKLLFLLDLGFDMEVPEIHRAINEIIKHRDELGIFQSLMNIPTHFGGKGIDEFTWCICDAPLLLKALLITGMDYDEYIKPGVEYLVSLCRDNGFPCAAAKELGRFRGPGRKNDCCPYATLIMADLLSYIPEYKNSQAAKYSVEALLGLWENSYDQHPYIFYMGKDFRKLKAPSNWYDIVSVTNVLSRYEFVREDSRFMEMVSLIKNKQDENGFFTPESVYKKYKNWDFGQKKERSAYLTYLCLRTFDRLNN